MPSRAVVWTLAIVAVVLVVVPLLGMLGMMTCCGGAMTGHAGAMMGMGLFGIVWGVLAAAVIIAVIVVLVRAAKKA